MSERESLAKWRFEKAESCLRAAKLLFGTQDCHNAANRLYYCVFHCISSIFALDGVDFKRHSAVIAHFRQNYIKTGILSTQLSDIIGRLFTIRTESDYGDFFTISENDTADQVENAEFFLNHIKTFLINQGLSL